MIIENIFWTIVPQIYRWLADAEVFKKSIGQHDNFPEFFSNSLLFVFFGAMRFWNSDKWFSLVLLLMKMYVDNVIRIVEIVRMNFGICFSILSSILDHVNILIFLFLLCVGHIKIKHQDKTKKILILSN